MIRHYLFFILLVLANSAAMAAQVKVAVASNFTAPMREIATRFEQATGHQAVVSYGSTGKLYTQIRHGAPFQVFLAADQERPQRIHQAGLGAVPHTYAIGRLVLWSSDPKLIDSSGVLQGGQFRRIAIANPKTAPYGAGALQILDTLGVKQQLTPKLVRGDNIAQTFQFVTTGNAQLGFVAYSQVARDSNGSQWLPPQSLYQPLRQDAVLLEKGSGNPAALAFMDFLLSDEAQGIVSRYGYGAKTVALQ